VNDGVTEMKTWWTAIPLAYADDRGFWGRDAGGLCLAFRQMGMDSKMVALGESSYGGKHPVIVQTQKTLEDPVWWREQNIDGLVFYSWAAPRWRKIAAAVRGAGIRLVLKLDTDGTKNPRVWWYQYVSRMALVYRARKHPFPLLMSLGKALVFRWIPSVHDTGMLEHMGYADVIGAESPMASARLKHLLRIYHRVDLAEKVRVIPHPVSSYMHYNRAVPKDKIILVVGRWDDAVKGGSLLMKVLPLILRDHPDYRAVVVGKGEGQLQRIRQHFSEDIRSRVQLVGAVPHAELPDYYQKARILLVPSVWETFCIAAAEALCCGCSVVGASRISSMNWFVSRSSGTLASSYSVDRFVDALGTEIESWEMGSREAETIAEKWKKLLASEAVARNIADPDFYL
jgi:glycosyltransferase involved in cell wall biosynthesis